MSINLNVVPANAGTYIHSCYLLEVSTTTHIEGPWRTGPRIRGDDAGTAT